MLGAAEKLGIRYSERQMIMVLPFLTAFVAAVLAMRGKAAGAFGWSLATVAISVAWLFYHATSKLDIVL